MRPIWSSLLESTPRQPGGGSLRITAVPRNVLHGVDGLATCDAVSHFHQRPLGVAIDEDVGLWRRSGWSDGWSRPVVVMGDTAQGCLDAADDHRHLFRPSLQRWV